MVKCEKESGRRSEMRLESTDCLKDIVSGYTSFHGSKESWKRNHIETILRLDCSEMSMGRLLLFIAAV